MGAATLTGLGAFELAREISAGRLSAIEAVDAYVARIEEVNPSLNALVLPRFDDARAEAEAADRSRGHGAEIGALHGVPITVKECLELEGLPATAGLARLADVRSTRDALLVARLRRAGAIVLGKTNLSQLVWFNDASNPVYGRTNNPWDLDRGPGGSSGGEAAIVAAGGSALGLGTDSGGSVRLPAHCCGIHALKPTSGRVSLVGSVEGMLLDGNEGILNQAGPLARNVADLRLAMDVLCRPGFAVDDPGVPPVPWRDPAEIDVRGLRVGVYDHLGVFSVSPAVRRVVAEAAAALAHAGAAVEAFAPPDVGEALRVTDGIFGSDGGARIRRALEGSPADEKWSAVLAEVEGQRVPVDAYWDFVAARSRYRLRFLEALDEQSLDALVCPVFALPALPHGMGLGLEPAAAYSNLFNLLGLPAGALAASRVRPGEESDRSTGEDASDLAAAVERGSAGLPVAVQVAARWWREDVVLALMDCLEGEFRSMPDYPLLPPL
jgi:fatty acid amide hydrolase